MYEVEVKVRANVAAVRRRLEARDAEKIATVTQADTYYDAPHRDFAETDEALRIRRETRDGETSARITYKGPLVEAESKTREEVETGVDDGQEAASIFGNLGFTPAATVRKERTFYRYRGYTVTLDTVEDVGKFVEVETETEEEGVQAAREGAYEVLRDLDLDPDGQIRTSYLGMLLDNTSE